MRSRLWYSRRAADGPPISLSPSNEPGEGFDNNLLFSSCGTFFGFSVHSRAAPVMIVQIETGEPYPHTPPLIGMAAYSLPTSPNLSLPLRVLLRLDVFFPFISPKASLC